MDLPATAHARLQLNTQTRLSVGGRSDFRLDVHAGGYHPVRLGEKFKQGRYVVLKKLGWGHFSTVWLVLDTHSNTFAALKVIFVSESKPL